MTEKPLVIAPKTKIYDLLEAYPQLEGPLVSLAPAFQKLQNPVLRKTITRVTTLSQAAAIGGLKVEELVNRLRKEAGQTEVGAFEHAGQHYDTRKPDWFKERRISQTIDVREILDEGNQPVHEVLSAIRSLKKNEVLEVIAPFLPAPLIDKAAGAGHPHWVKEVSTEEYRIYFRI
jgi:hypothetical protein